MASTLGRFESSRFLLVGTTKNSCVCVCVCVCEAPADNEEALHHRIVDACQTIRNYPGIFERMRRSIMRRVEAWIESDGGHLEHLL
jgi:hypothetical protein